MPEAVEWAKQVCRQRVFDNLIANIDRNAGNILVDGEWNLILIDHSRAFAQRQDAVREGDDPGRPGVLREAEGPRRGRLMKQVRPWVLGDGTVRAILKRRDKIVAHFEKLARERGEAVVFPF